jgi:hypothetical protein
MSKTTPKTPKKKKTTKKAKPQPKPKKKPQAKTLSEMMTEPPEPVEPLEPLKVVTVELTQPESPEMDTSPPVEVSSSPESPPDAETEIPIDYGGQTVDLEELAEELGITSPTEEPVVKPVEVTPVHPLCRDIRAYCTEHSIALILKALCEAVPEAMPNYRTWKCPDPIPIIHNKIHSKGYVEELLGPLNVMLGTNIQNIQWTARVVIAIASFDIVREL